MHTTNRSAFVLGAGLGATLMCLLDPVRGARRRGRLRDGVSHATNVAARGAGKAGRDVWHRAQGTAASLRHLVQPATADDRILEGRVRANLGRIASHPHAVRVEVTDGIATLTGPILDREADHLIRASAGVRGVRRVEDRLERHKQAGDHPALQGGRAPVGDRLDLLQENWAPATRLAVGIAGSALLASGARRRDAAGLAAVTAGSALLARALANVPIGRFVGVTEDLVRMKTLVETGRFPRDAAQAPATSQAPVADQELI